MNTQPLAPINWREEYDLQTKRLSAALEDRRKLVAALREVAKDASADMYDCPLGNARRLLREIDEE